MRTGYVPAVRFLVLGPLAVEAAADPVALGGRKQKLVLAHLLRRPNGWVSTETLIDDVWGEEPPGAAKGSLQSYVSNLRRALGADRLETGAGGYRLMVEPGELDALEFEQALARANAEIDGDPREASDLFRRALGLWRGSAFSDLAHEPSLVGEIERLDQERLQAIEGRIDADLALGRHTEVVAELDDLTRRWPLREHLWGQRMLALYRAERPAEALAAYRDARSILVDQLGVEPGRPLQRLHERILLQDPELDLPTTSDGRATIELDNPYKGLRPFRERDEQDFHGREELTGQLVATLEGDARLVTLIGPSGSGKSSAVAAGLIPALRKQHSGVRWEIASMRPGAHPFTEFDAALGRAFPSSTSRGAEHWDTWLLESVLRALPDDGSRLLLLIDQFEELFTLVDDATRDRFLAGLVTAAEEPGDRLRVLVVLRADFFDRPLAYPVFGRLMTEHIVHVLPLGPSELEAAAAKPAERVGVSFESGLLAELIADVSRQPNALPLFQYALTELFDRREGDDLTLARYEALGGLRGAVASRAEDTFARLDPDRQEAARQLFLRLVRVGAGTATRRVVRADELASLDVDLITMQGAVEAFVSNRLLAVDRDPASEAATVEVAHEALLSEWQRLAEWIETGRADLRQHRSYAAIVREWVAADRDPDYLLSGGRLERFEEWRAATTMRLTEDERMFLDAATNRRDEASAAEAERQEAETRLRSRARRRSFAVGVGAAAVIAAVLVVALLPAGEDEPSPSITSLSYGSREDDMLNELGEQGFARAEQELGVRVQRADVLLPPATVIAEAAAAGTDLLVLDGDATFEVAFEVSDAEGLFVPPTHYVLAPIGSGAPIDSPNVTNLELAFEQSGFLAGVAAASTTRSGTIGYVGAWEGSRDGSVVFRRFRAGYEAGARWVDPDVRILAGTISDYDPDVQVFDAPDIAERIARLEYGMGADVVFHATGLSGAGVFEAAVEESTPDRHLWAIGVDTDQWQTATQAERRHILTSSMIRWDIVNFGLIRDFVEGTLEPGIRRLTVDDGIITYSRSGDALSPGAIANLDRAIEEITSGVMSIPGEPSGELLQPTG
jgi:basic membrane lipoprotein Med (substrate-binding protein (PBP1-ABC) superfamily)/DNA-binding SARP family transcriptional activator